MMTERLELKTKPEQSLGFVLLTKLWLTEEGLTADTNANSFSFAAGIKSVYLFNK